MGKGNGGCDDKYSMGDLTAAELGSDDFAAIASFQEVFDQQTRDTYTQGQCAALAIALHDRIGGQLLASWTEAGLPTHVGLEVAPGIVADIDGVYAEADWLEKIWAHDRDEEDAIDEVREVSRDEALTLEDFPTQDISAAGPIAEQIADLVRRYVR